MEACYRSLPKFIGAFFDTLYQHPSMMLIFMVGIAGLAGSWWYKTKNNAE
ncbi:MAG: hypothetical protein ACU836_13770 [Gammaproteobacteria bacterium]